MFGGVDFLEHFDWDEAAAKQRSCRPRTELTTANMTKVSVTQPSKANNRRTSITRNSWIDEPSACEVRWTESSHDRLQTAFLRDAPRTRLHLDGCAVVDHQDAFWRILKAFGWSQGSRVLYMCTGEAMACSFNRGKETIEESENHLLVQCREYLVSYIDTKKRSMKLVKSFNLISIEPYEVESKWMLAKNYYPENNLSVDNWNKTETYKVPVVRRRHSAEHPRTSHVELFQPIRDHSSSAIAAPLDDTTPHATDTEDTDATTYANTAGTGTDTDAAAADGTPTTPRTHARRHRRRQSDPTADRLRGVRDRNPAATRVRPFSPALKTYPTPFLLPPDAAKGSDFCPSSSCHSAYTSCNSAQDSETDAAASFADEEDDETDALSDSDSDRTSTPPLSPPRSFCDSRYYDDELDTFDDTAVPDYSEFVGKEPATPKRASFTALPPHLLKALLSL